jgi:very-short-patch-repair endonuclease
MPFDIAARIEAWRTQLLDTTKRNRLIGFKSGRTGGISLLHPDPGDLWHRLVASDAPLTFVWKRDLIDLPPDPGVADADGGMALFDPAGAADHEASLKALDLCRRSPRLRDDHLLTDLPDRRLAARLTRLALTSRESLTEQGVAILYVAFGFLRWFESPDSQVGIRAPLLLVPVRLERDSVAAPWSLRAEDEDILPNHSLAQLLASDFQLRLPLPEEEAADPDDPTWRTRYYGEVERRVRHHPRWEVLDEAALGTFGFQKLAMWDDLDRNRGRITAHDLCRAVAGDPAVGLRQPADLPTAQELDRKADPVDTYHILDADSSQHEAIEAAKRRASFILDGPPGTGKSQTIANIIAESLAAGRTVLFVSEKAAALEVVQRRLEGKGLADFCLACHSHKANKRDVATELGRCLALGPESPRDARDDLQRLAAARQQLNEYVRELHAPRPPLGMTVYQTHGELARLSGLARASRCPIPQVLGRDGAYLRHVVDLLARLPDCRSVIEARDRHPWRGCRATVYSLTLRDDVRHHFGRLAACLGGVGEATAVLHQLGFGFARPTRAQWRAAVGTARVLLACPPVPAAWFKGDPRAVAQAVAQLDGLSQAYRRARAALPEFAPEALHLADANALSALAASPAAPRLVPRPGDTVQSLRRRLAALATALRDARRLTESVDRAVERVGELLRMALPAQPVKGLARLADLATLVARTGPVRPSWWDAGRRKELQGVLARCQEEARAAREVRAELAPRLSPRAFAPESAAVAAQASRFRSFLARLLRVFGWWSLKGRVGGWYVEEPPKTRALLADLARLAGYHRRLDYCQQVQAQYADDLAAGAAGEVAWDKTLRALESVDRLERLTKIPAKLQTALSAEGGLDRGALAAAARALAEQVGFLRQRLEAVAQDYDLAEVTDGPPGQVRLTARDLATWLEAQVGAVGRQAALLEQVSGFLAEGRDVAAEALPARVRALAEVGKARAQVAGLCARVWPGQPQTRAEERDWSALSGAATALLRLLDRWRGPLPPAVARVLTDPAAHGQLADAVRLGDAACAGGFEESWWFLTGLFDLGRPVSTGLTVEATPLPDLRAWLAQQAEDAHRIYEWTLFCEVEREVVKAGVSPLLAEVLAGQVKPENAGEAFRARFLGLWLDATYERVPALRQFASDRHERLIERFRELDRLAVASAAARIRAFQLSRPDRPRLISGDAPASSELGTLLREVNKKRRHLPLRKLFEAIPNLLLRLKPCLMMSPLAVSTYLHHPDLHFDLVIFDEASQVRPHDAVCAIYRGRQLIVAGDQKQLPPTDFFARSLDDEGLASEEGEGDGGGLEDYESVLDVCRTLGLPRRRLRWHYRSRREGLIAFANRFIYANELVTFPSVHDMAGNPAVAFAYVADGRWKAGASGGFNAVEARRTAELVLAHFRERPEQSLGVIAFSQRQQLRILDELERQRRANPDLEGFFGEGRDEPFFVKNLENVQGDERDVIFLGIGYGPDETGRVALRFGPLNREGGERRLNVAVTRARRGMVVVSSLRAHDIDLSRTAAVGVKLLRAYLDYAERGTEALRGAITGAGEREFDSPFEREVYEELTRRGLTVHPQVGCSGFRIDLAVVDPRASGRYLLGVECDGATYHSSATARDRDRLRQEVLEGLGWRICRIWSTDWVRGREGQVRRVQAALEKAQREEAPPPKSPDPLQRVTAPQDPGGQAAPGSVAAATVTVTPDAASYDSIDDVPEHVLREVICQALRAFGATEADELAQAVARQLGFKRTGKRIQARVEAGIDRLVQAGVICRAADQRLQVASATRASSA